MDLTDLELRVRSLGTRIRSELNTFRHKIERGNSRDHRIENHAGPTSVLQSDELAELELLSESLRIDKEKIVDGEISIRKEVITELQTIRVPVTREELVIERRSADGRCTTEVLAGQHQLRIPISKERVLVSKEHVISEVARISRRKIREIKRVSGNVRHEELRVSGEDVARFSGKEDEAA
jgi:uncharacterized protein (TIGR02271 family)